MKESSPSLQPLKDLFMPFVEKRAKVYARKMKELTPQEIKTLTDHSRSTGSALDPLDEIDIKLSQAGQFVPRGIVDRRIELMTIRDCNILLDKWLPLLEAFTRFKHGLLRQAEFDGHMLPWLTGQALRCFASNKLYPRVLPTPDGLPAKDLWLYGHQPFLSILSDVKESLAIDQVLPREVIDHLSAKTGLTIMTTYE